VHLEAKHWILIKIKIFEGIRSIELMRVASNGLPEWYQRDSKERLGRRFTWALVNGQMHKAALLTSGRVPCHRADQRLRLGNSFA
jgi:hypothetical protein